MIPRSLSTSALAAQRATQTLTLSPTRKTHAKPSRCRCGATAHAQFDASLTEMTLCSVKRDDLFCPICFDVLCFPVTLPCGHNFDRGCILTAWRYDAPAARTPNNQQQRAHVCPLCRQEAGIASVNDLQVNLLLKDVIAKLFPLETASAATLEKQLAAAQVVALVPRGNDRDDADPTRARHSFRALSSFAYVCVASVTDPPGFVLAVLLLLALLAIACNPQHAVAGNASAALTIVDVLDRVVNGFSVLIREFSLTLDQLQQLKPFIRAFSFVL